MKKSLVLFIALVAVISTLSACGKREVVHVVNAEILEISSQLNGFVVKGLDQDSILGEKCYISCETSGESTKFVYYLYVDNNSGEITDLSYDDFIVGDHITVDVVSVENKYSVSSRVQLLTQRL